MKPETGEGPLVLTVELLAIESVERCKVCIRHCREDGDHIWVWNHCDATSTHTPHPNAHKYSLAGTASISCLSLSQRLQKCHIFVVTESTSITLGVHGPERTYCFSTPYKAA